MSIPDYPRTLHLGDSGGRASRHGCSFAEVAGHDVVVEEKVDGSHCGLFFDEQAELRIFTRRTILESPPLRRDFRRLDQLASEQLDGLWDVLGTRYVLYGEWAHHTHSIFYDALPSYFLEDDVFDREEQRFLATVRRRPLVERLPPGFRSSVPVLHQGPIDDIAQLHALVGASAYKTVDWRERCPDPSMVEDCDDMEGLYIKQEDDDSVLRRFKWVRPGFLAHIAAAEQHWRDRPELHNELCA
ncbi:RNA ligase family protein [Enhygromyxa salina]|uniref:RNA ligase domain-containing protein n=1 Tax=Enhygromyxa salina TaxID=215803 RepID=A0A2S9YDC3_9BACT|nr:RNA ligase family protein [Enhygromyxa salina]PRQ03103.1 hypothetical protein ENSA7_53740 [Enhygromyxa salina]